MCISLLFLKPKLSFAQSPDTSFLNSEYQRALFLMNENQNWNLASALAQQALKQLKDDQWPDLKAQWLNVQGDCQLELGNYQQSKRFFQDAIQLLEGKSFKAQLAETLNKYGNFYIETKNFEQAYSMLEQALAIRKKILPPRHLKLAQSYNNLGRCINELGDHDKALEYYDLAVSIRLEKLEKPHPEIARSYLNRGTCHMDNGESFLARADYKRALKQFQDYYAEDRVVTADVYFNLADSYESTQELVAAKEHYQNALKIYSSALKPDHPILALCYTNLGNIYAKLSNYNEEAIHYHQLGLKIRIQWFGKVHHDVAETLYNIGAGYFIKGDLGLAKQNFESCFESLNFIPAENPDFAKVNNFKILISALKMMAILQGQRYNASQDQEDLVRAMDYYYTLDQLIDFLRIRYETHGAKLSLAKEAHEIYDGAIFNAQLLFQLTQDPGFAQDAFQFSEKSKGLLLLQALKQSEAQLFSKTDQLKLDKLRALELSLTEIEKSYFLESSNPLSFENGVIDSIQTLIFNQKQQLSELVDGLKKSAPEYYNLRYHSEALSIKEIQKSLLTTDQTLIEYFIGGSFLYVFVINKEDFRIIQMRYPPELTLWLDLFRKAIQNFAYTPSKMLAQNIGIYQQSAYGLYQILIEPIEELLGKRITIIPGDELEFIPFEALLSHPADSLGFRFSEYPYLIQHYTINYNYSANLWSEMQKKRKIKAEHFFLGLAPHFTGDSTLSLADLKFNSQEVTNIRNSIGGHILIDEEATKKNFLKNQSNYRILHLATHGMANNSWGDFSFLAFSPQKSESIFNSLLYVKEIYNLSINAEMVVLSACETGTGELQKGEGMASIARSFSYAGAKSLIASKWSVDDEATSTLMEFFYDGLQSKASKDQALREAKIKFIEVMGNRKAHPYYWASFVPIGNMEAITTRNYLFSILWIIPIALIGYLAYFWMKVKKMEHQLFKGH